LAANRSEAERRKWELIHPRSQLITKTDLAKYEHTWSQLPHIVSRGGQKCYLDFMDALDQRGAFDPDESYFERCVSRAILFRQCERIVSRQKFGGYRANIVTYVLAWLSHHTAKRVDLGAIWSTQELSNPLAAFLEVLSVHAHAHITSPPGGQNVTEWCKKEACWERFRDTAIKLPAEVEAGLLTRDKASTSRSASVLEEQASSAESEQVDRVASIPAQTWFDLAAWAKDTQTLQAWQRSLAFSLGRLASSAKKPSRKQAMHGEKIIEEARKLGFRGEP
jgi:hypothetical protein